MTQEGGFTALVLDEADGKVTSRIKTLDDDALPEGNVVVSVAYSDLNYKDGLVLGGSAGWSAITRISPGSTFPASLNHQVRPGSSPETRSSSPAGGSARSIGAAMPPRHG